MAGLPTIVIGSFVGRAADPNNPPLQLKRNGLIAYLGQFEAADHLDNLSRPGRLTPFSAPTAITSGQNNISALKRAAHDGKLYGLGTGSSDAFANMYRITDPIADTSWSARSNPATGGNVQPDMLEEYHGALYFWADDSGTIGKHDIDSPVAADMTDWNSVTLSPAPGPGHYFSALDALNIAYGNKIAQIINDAFTPDKLVLADKLVIASMAEWNGYECIGCRGLDDNSIVYFWDGASDKPAFGYEIRGEYLLALRNAGGELVAVTAPSSSNILRPRLSFYVLQGSEFQLVYRHASLEGTETGASVILPERTARVKNSQLYFAAGLQTGAATTEYGIWRFGVNGGTYALTKDRFATSDNSETFGNSIGALDWFGDFAFCVHTANGTITRSGGSGSAAANFRTGQLDFLSRSARKKITIFSIATMPLSADDSVAVQYSIDGGAFQDWFTHSGNGQIATAIATAKIRDVPIFHTIDFKCSPTVGAEIMEIIAQAEITAQKYGADS